VSFLQARARSHTLHINPPTTNNNIHTTISESILLQWKYSEKICRALWKSKIHEAIIELAALRNGLSGGNKRIAKSNHYDISSLLTCYFYVRNIQDSTEYYFEKLSSSMVLWRSDIMVTSYGFEVLAS